MCEETESSRRELRRLLCWIKDNPDDWHDICSVNGRRPDISHISGLIDRLYEENLYTLIFFVLYSNNYISEVQWAINQTAAQGYLDVPAEILLERLRGNLKAAGQPGRVFDEE